jgi:hypothetical protein
MNFQAYCFVCEKRVSALTILDKEGLWKALDSGADVEVIHTGVRGTEAEFTGNVCQASGCGHVGALDLYFETMAVLDCYS